MAKKQSKQVGKKSSVKNSLLWTVVGLVAAGTIAGGSGGDTKDNQKIPDEPAMSIEETDTSRQTSDKDTFIPNQKQEVQPEEKSQQDELSALEPEPEPEPEPDSESEAEPEPEPEPEPAPPQEQPPAKTNASGKDRRGNWENGYYLGSSESDKYHDYECRAAKKILPKNEVWFDSEDQAKSRGYSRCGICW